MPGEQVQAKISSWVKFNWVFRYKFDDDINFPLPRCLEYHNFRINYLKVNLFESPTGFLQSLRNSWCVVKLHSCTRQNDGIAIYSCMGLKYYYPFMIKRSGSQPVKQLKASQLKLDVFDIMECRDSCIREQPFSAIYKLWINNRLIYIFVGHFVENCG